MRIAQVAPLTESVPPKLYGGTERVVAYLTDELVEQGHEVTLFASGDSQTRATLVPCVEQAQRLAGGCRDHVAAHLLMVEHVIKQAANFDLIHFHLTNLHFPALRRCPTAHATTLHGRLDLPELVPLFDEFSEVPVVSISNAQRRPLPNARWCGTIHHGLPPREFRFQKAGEYLAFLGRVSPEKGVDSAIAIAKACGWPLRIAAKVDPADQSYFEQEIRPLLQHPLIDFIGEISEGDKSEFLGGAKALLFPIDWPEPFGLVMIEALACGTPVVAFRRGSVPEILEDGVTAFIVDDLEQAVAATRRVGELSRLACRRSFERRFSARRMASDYVRLYRRLIADTSSNLVA